MRETKPVRVVEGEILPPGTVIIDGTPVEFSNWGPITESPQCGGHSRPMRMLTLMEIWEAQGFDPKKED